MPPVRPVDLEDHGATRSMPNCRDGGSYPIKPK
jgi:hypothetical protein